MISLDNTLKYPDVSSLLTIQTINNAHDNESIASISSQDNSQTFRSRNSSKSKASKHVERDNSDSGNQPVACKWEDCMVVFLNSELLYRHVCDVHATKQKHREFEYTCKWGACTGLKIKKREHLVSHLMVHIPMKKFKCVTCQKKFKRSHDLKKHVKIHLKNVSDDLNHSTECSLDSFGSQSSSLIHEQFIPDDYMNLNSRFLNPPFESKNNTIDMASMLDEHLEEANIFYEPPKDIVEDLFSQFQDLKSKYYQAVQDPINNKSFPQYPAIPQAFATVGNPSPKSTDPPSWQNQDLQQKYHYQDYSMFNLQGDFLDQELSNCENLSSETKFSIDQQSSKEGIQTQGTVQIIDFIKENILTDSKVLDNSEMDAADFRRVVEKSSTSKIVLQTLVQYLYLCL